MREKRDKFMHWLMNSKAERDGMIFENMKERKKSENVQWAGIYTALGGIALTLLGKFLEYRNQCGGSVDDYMEVIKKEKEESSEE